MGWWPAGGNEDGVIGDGPADAIGCALEAWKEARIDAHQGLPTLQEFIDLLSAILQHRLGESAKNVRATLSNAQIFEPRHVAEKDVPAQLRQVVDQVIEMYKHAWERAPSLREILRTFEFVIRGEPDQFFANGKQMGSVALTDQ